MREDVLDLFDVDPTVLHLNPGAFGMVPRAVRAAQREWSDRIEANPMPFFRLHAHDALASVRDDIGRHLGVSADSIAFVRNVSEAVGVILVALRIGPGDEVVVSNHGYPTLAMAVRARGAQVREARFDVDATDEQIVQAFAEVCGPRTKLVAVDAITSPTALELPVAEVVAAVGEVPVYVDAAHSAGMQQVDIEALGAAFWATNLHKWSFTPRGTGALWVAPSHRDSALPAVTSWTSPAGFPAAHDFPGTVDFSVQLAIPSGLQFWRDHGGPEIADRLRTLLHTGAEIVHRRIAVAFPGDVPDFDPQWPTRTAAGMRLVPLPDGLIESEEHARQVYDGIHRRGVESPPVFFDGRGYLRLGAQIHVEEFDYDRCADAVVAALQEQAGRI